MAFAEIRVNDPGRVHGGLQLVDYGVVGEWTVMEGDLEADVWEFIH